MYTDGDEVTSTDDYNLMYKVDTKGGQSGSSPIWEFSSGNRTITLDGKCFNY